MRRLSGAVSGQLSQALGSFALQVVAAHELGASGLGVFALVYSAMITTTAFCNGLVGDSLTVLERGRAEIRSALQTWCVIASLGTGVATSLLYWWGGVIDLRVALWFAAANATFLVESMCRRLLMAVLRFWSLVAVDLSSLVVSLSVLVAWQVWRPMAIEVLLASLVVGQLVAIVVALVLLPESERWLAPWRPSALRRVAAFGLWRAIQQCLRPGMLTLGRLIVTAAVGAALFGQMEAGRVYMSPALLVVQGLGSYLFSTYAHAQDQRWHVLVSRADRAAVTMLGLTMAIGCVGTVLVPVFGPLVTGSTFSLVPAAVFGWAVYAASTAAVMPYASLAAIRGRQRLVVSLRALDSAASLGLLAVVMLQGNASASWAPYLLAVGSFVDGAVIRWILLSAYVRRERATSGHEGVVAAVEVES